MVAHREPSAPKQPTNRAIGRDVGSPLGSSTRPRIPKNAPGTPVHGSGFAGPGHGTRLGTNTLLQCVHVLSGRHSHVRSNLLRLT